MMESFFNHKKDILILTNALINMTQDGYTEEDIKEHELCKAWKPAN